jgi:hypothetical protein
LILSTVAGNMDNEIEDNEIERNAAGDISSIGAQ